MDIYASDEEKGEEIKQWWRDNGRTVVIACVLGVASLFGTRYWMNYQQVQTESASLLFQQISSSDSLTTDDKTDAAAKELLARYSHTAYAVFAALEMANRLAATDSASTKSYLQWVIDNAELGGHKQIARLRLAQVLLEQSDYDAALALTEQSNSTAFTSLFLELRGDIQAAKNETKQAYDSYQTAIMSLEQGEPRRQLLQLKLDDMAISDEQ